MRKEEATLLLTEEKASGFGLINVLLVGRLQHETQRLGIKTLPGYIGRSYQNVKSLHISNYVSEKIAARYCF